MTRCIFCDGEYVDLSSLGHLQSEDAFMEERFQNTLGSDIQVSICNKCHNIQLFRKKKESMYPPN